jgi:hypothetical protein
MTEFTRFKIKSPNIIHETIDGETVIVNLDSGNYYSLDKVGTNVWSSIEKESSLQQIIEAIFLHYEADGEEIKKAISQLLTALHEEDLVVTFESDKFESDTVPAVRDRTDSGEKRLSFEVPFLHKYDDMQELLLLDPIHEVDETGWPNMKPEQDTSQSLNE